MESELGRVVTQRLGSGRVLAVDSSDLMQMVGGLGAGAGFCWPWPSFGGLGCLLVIVIGGDWW